MPPPVGALPTQSYICLFFFDVFFSLFFEGAVFDDRDGSTPVPGNVNVSWLTEHVALMPCSSWPLKGSPVADQHYTAHSIARPWSLIFATDFIFRRARSSRRRDRQASLASHSPRANEL